MRCIGIPPFISIDGRARQFRDAFIRAAIAVDQHILYRTSSEDLAAIREAAGHLDDAISWYHRFRASDVIQAGNETLWLICQRALKERAESPEKIAALLEETQGILRTITDPCGVRPYDRQYVQAREVFLQLSRAAGS